MHFARTYSQMPLKRLRHTVNVPSEIEPLIQRRKSDERYRSISDYFVSLAVFDIYARRKHILTAQLMNEPREIQDKVFEELRDSFDRADAKPGAWFEHRIDEIVNTRRRKGQSQLAKVRTDREGRVTNVNEAFTEMCGHSLAEMLGKKPGEVLQGEETEQSVVRAFRKAIKEHRAFESTMTNYHKDGSTYRVHIKMEPIFKGKTLTGYQAEEHKLEPPPQ